MTKFVHLEMMRACDDRYVERMEVNGVAVDLQNHPFVDHASLVRKQGASLEFWMTSEEPEYAAKLPREKVLQQQQRLRA